MERGVAVLLGGFAIAGVICVVLLLTGVFKMDVAFVAAPAASSEQPPR